MMGGPGRFGNIMNQETMKPRSLGNTLGRLVGYFGRFWPVVFMAVLFVVVSTWTQVTTPELTGQATDCFLVPLGANSSFGGAFSGASTQAAQSESACWMVADPSTLHGTQWIVASAYRFGGYIPQALASMTNDDRIAGSGAADRNGGYPVRDEFPAYRYDLL